MKRQREADPCCSGCLSGSVKETIKQHEEQAGKGYQPSLTIVDSEHMGENQTVKTFNANGLASKVIAIRSTMITLGHVKSMAAVEALRKGRPGCSEAVEGEHSRIQDSMSLRPFKRGSPDHASN